jgi:hypothetical protein
MRTESCFTHSTKHILTRYSYVENIILKLQIESCVIAPRAGDSKFDENSLFCRNIEKLTRRVTPFGNFINLTSPFK